MKCFFSNHVQMKNNNTNSLFFYEIDILNIHLTNTIHRINDSIKNQSYTVDKFRNALVIWSRVVGIMGGCLGYDWLL